jgi:hypothetical protein
MSSVFNSQYFSLYFLALIPVHTRVLFDILQEAYRIKAQGKSTIDSKNKQIDFDGLLRADGASTSSTKTLKSDFITHESKKTKTEHVIPADGIQLEKIFPEISTMSDDDIYTQNFTTQVSQMFETTEQNEYNNETSFSTNMIIHTTENVITTTLLPLKTVENMMTASLEENQTNYLNITKDSESVNITEQFNTMITSVPIQWSSYNNSDNNTIVYTKETNENSTEQIGNNTESQKFLMTITSQTIDYTSSNETDNYKFNSSEQTITSTLIPINQTLSTDKSIDTVETTQSVHSQLLLKLCQQLLSHILPNISSLSSSAAVQAALSLSAGSPSSSNNSADALLAWINEQLNSSSTTTTTTATSKTISSYLPSLLINERKLSSNSLQRVDMDEVLHQMNNNIDGEN